MAWEGGILFRIADLYQRNWRWLVLLVWIGTCAYLIWERWWQIQNFGLADTDDNLRMMQVRALLLEGQGWYDLRQYRLNPPDGLNVHWSRIVDLPLAGLWLLFGWFMDGPAAERWATAIAPLLPLLILLGALALTARRLLSPYAFWMVLALAVCAGTALGQFAPTRTDHHGWQLAMLAVVVAGIADPKQVRGGVTMGIASAVSLTIGLEMLLYVAVAGIAVGLFWVRDAADSRRLTAYGASFAGGCALGFLVFASNDNWSPMCDALSPVWLSMAALAGAAAVLLPRLRLPSMWWRLGAALVAGAVLAACYVLFWPHCLGRLEGVPPELDQLWLSNVREARAIYTHGLGSTVETLILPVLGMIGYIAILWQTRRDPELFQRWYAIAAAAAIAICLLLWQTRSAGPAQLLAIPGIAAWGWLLIDWVWRQRSLLVQVIAGTAAASLVIGIIVADYLGLWHEQREQTAYEQAINKANWLCPQKSALWPIEQQPKGRVLTHVDMGPRLVTLTKHDAIAGPYHRNVDAILDTMRAFRGDAANAKAIIDRRQIDYVLVCPNMSETTIYRSAEPNGWYAQLVNNQIPAWLEPVQLPQDSPFRMWRVRR